jgi:hypothetical protein
MSGFLTSAGAVDGAPGVREFCFAGTISTSRISGLLDGRRGSERRLSLLERIELFAFAVRRQCHPAREKVRFSHPSRPFMDQILQGSSGAISPYRCAFNE